jgi:hypothetical protein
LGLKHISFALNCQGSENKEFTAPDVRHIDVAEHEPTANQEQVHWSFSPIFELDVLTPLGRFMKKVRTRDFR